MSNNNAQLIVPNHLTSFRDHIDFYIQNRPEKKLTVNKLSEYSRLEYRQVQKIIYGYTKNPQTTDLIALCLVLRLSRTQSIDLLARVERAISPADPAHDIYLELFDIYSAESSIVQDGPFMLDYADSRLEGVKPNALPNVNKKIT